MSTYGYEGTPLGKYKVVVTKNIQDNLVYAESSTGTKEVVGWTSYRTVEPNFSDAKTTPHEIEITGKDKKFEVTFDVGKAVRSRM
ncbi:MAG: hypothetical protein LBQ54_00080 [Planctomycetaceae bacterium]|jgi:hypothetical protein|nr:hypothetical protein [Planctomycetaceae bacterium]